MLASKMLPRWCGGSAKMVPHDGSRVSLKSVLNTSKREDRIGIHAKDSGETTYEA